MRVIYLRAVNNVGMGDGGNTDLARSIRGHSNFAEYTPICLLLLAMNEISGYVSSTWVSLLGGAFLIGRLLHAYAFWNAQPFFIGRVGGTALTLTVLVFLSVFCFTGDTYQGITAATIGSVSVAAFR
eukprot:CAMPEP_0184485392 /NCGR_PEP_ID=MMETSP0113_2-20130426/7010_1 /TAXON_ID=91329 /ORGANISM="Norrisiella sphaerica, Strain BC52" /LENGTH=126 /DNA_ID=CAMNT_0026866819 /DNA_START=29 /DNA_END=406 /DNA_ORIENTATION=+